MANQKKNGNTNEKVPIKEPKQALVVPETKLELEKPSYIREGNAGLENLTGRDLIVPRLVLMQALSPQVEENEFRPGDIVHSLLGECWITLGEKAEFIPIQHFKEWIQWAPRASNKGIIDRSRDPNSALAHSAAAFEKDESGNIIVTEYHNFIVVLREYGTQYPVMLSCAKTNHKKARALLGLARYRGPYPLYSGVYTMEALKETNKQLQSYYVYNFENSGWVSREEYDVVEKLHKSLKDVTVVASDDAGLQEDLSLADASDI